MKVVDMHCDTISLLYHQKEEGKEVSLLKNVINVDLEKMKQSNYILQNFAMFVSMKDYPDTYTRVHQYIDYYYQEINKYPDIIKPIYNYHDILNNQINNRISAMLTIEEGAVVNNDISLLKHYYDLGVRMITLTWNYENGIGYPNFTFDGTFSSMRNINTKDGLTPFGIEYIQEMERLGIIIDVSHLSDAGFYDVLKYTTKPFVASHSNARSVCNVARNMSDDMIKQLASRGGVMGINFCGDFLVNSDNGGSRSCVKDMVKHILYIKDLVGIDYVGLGSDFDGIDQNLEMEDCSKLDILRDALLEVGLTDDEINKVFHQNVLRVYQQILK